MNANNTAERLLEYFPFEEDIVAAVHDVADWQKQMSYPEFFEALGITEPEVKAYEGADPIEVLDIRPKGDYDETSARVMHLPMANPLDPNMRYQAGTIFAADPTKRLIAAGNPSAPGYPTGKLSREARGRAAKGDLRDTVDPLLRYVEDQGVVNVEHFGPSYGAEKAVAAVRWSADYDLNATGSVHIEPVSVIGRSLGKLARDFYSVNKHLQRYVDLSDVPAFIEARKDSVGFLPYILALGRLSNLAMAKGMARGGFEIQMNEAMEHAPNVHASIVWGSESELALDGLALSAIYYLRHNWGQNRVGQIRLKGQYHNFPNDIHLHAAVVHQGLRPSSAQAA